VADDLDLLQGLVLLTRPVDADGLVACERVRAGARSPAAELGRVLAVVGVARDAARRLQRDVRAAELDAGAQEVGLREDPLRGLLGAGARQRDDELVAAEVPEYLVVAQTVAQRARDELHDLVACAVAERRD